LGHSSASIAQPWSIRLPISAEAVSDCALLTAASCGSWGANVGELNPLAVETSVGGVEALEASEVKERLLLVLSMGSFWVVLLRGVKEDAAVRKQLLQKFRTIRPKQMTYHRDTGCRRGVPVFVHGVYGALEYNNLGILRR